MLEKFYQNYRITLEFIPSSTMSITSDLEKFYDSEADKYHQTRQKHWSDSDMILNTLKSQETKHPVIIELWCWWWRWASLLEEKYDKPFTYTWVDISNNLLSLAKKDHPKLSFEHSDMISYLANQPQESADIILAFACFQHLPNEEQRIALLKNCYRVLKYNWIIIFTNRACSSWFIKTHRKPISIALLKSMVNFWKTTRRDVMIPRTSDQWTQYRYYHLYSLDELRRYTEYAWLKETTLEYLDRRWNVTNNRKYANNSFLVAKKTIYKK